ncbi:uncharacterized protein ColSpa_00669 [Colletotrichum spaethianum]|uniref:RRM domain-containing protein n=1 Tax=Colletotrichum spaethianum TaxID=700344 RepID=A0AA37L6H5_9PEZI|nr:uncharacterized protein ColSpa_00669 [Colletotrichum spaethianum]GKT40488.1 hypothetical protein ColSpa_00669 [Colletotrichum spaethianum]
MVDRIDSYFPGRILGQQQDDGGSTVYVSTDDGWTDDDEGNTGSFDAPAQASTILTHSGSPNLIDFDSSENDDIPDDSELTEKLTDVMGQVSDLQGTKTAFREIESLTLDLHPQAVSESNLDPTSAAFTPSCSWPAPGGQASPSSSSPSSYVDARQSLCSSDDLITSLQARIKQLEHDYDTLKRKNDHLDTLNEALRHRTDKSNATIEKLSGQLSKAELLRRRAQNYSSEISEHSKLDQEFLNKLNEDLDYNKTQLREFRSKYDRVLQSQEPLQSRLQELQTGLLNAVERNKMYEAYIRGFVANHPQHTAAFNAIGISTYSAMRGNNVTENGEVEPLISFDEMSLSTTAAPEPRQSDPTENATCFLDVRSEPGLQVAVSKSNHLECDQHYSHKALQQVLPQVSVRPRLLCAETFQLRGSHNAKDDALNWSTDCDDIWESALQRERALRNYQGSIGARQPSQTPGMFLYGIRYVRNQSDQTLTVNDEVPDIASRVVIMTGLPDEVHVQRVLEHIRGGRIFNAHTAPMGTGDFSYNHAYIEFTSTKDASEFCRFSCSRDFGFINQDGTLARVRTSLPATDSYPLNQSMQAWIDEGSTRCLAVAGFPVMHLEAILKDVGLAHNFTDVITHLAYSDDGSFEISFSSLKTAILVRKCILESSLWTGPADGRGVTFRPDPCDAPWEDLQEPFLPIHSTVHFHNLASENARLFMTIEERDAEEDHLRERMFEGCDPSDSDTVGLKDMIDRKSIVWEKTADWDNAVKYMAYDPDQQKEVLHRRDRESGAIQVWYHGGWAMGQLESWKAWEHYNIDSPHPYTQKNADLLYEVTGWVDRRKVNLYLKIKAERVGREEKGTDKNADRLSSTMADYKETLSSR